METVYDESLPVLERIKFPMVWERLVCSVRVEDLQPQRYKEALDIVENCFVEDDPICKGCNLAEEGESVEEFIKLVQFWLNSSQSFVAVDESNNKTVGVIVCRVNELAGHTITMSRTRIYENSKIGKMQRFINHIYKQGDIYTLFNTDAFYKIYVWCVVPDHRNKGIGKALLRTAVEQAVQFKMVAVAGVFTGAVSQHIGRSLKFENKMEIFYWQWKENEENVFDNPGPGNNSADLMVYINTEFQKSDKIEENKEKVDDILV